MSRGKAAPAYLREPSQTLSVTVQRLEPATRIGCDFCDGRATAFVTRIQLWERLKMIGFYYACEVHAAPYVAQAAAQVVPV